MLGCRLVTGLHIQTLGWMNPIWVKVRTRDRRERDASVYVYLFELGLELERWAPGPTNE